MGLSRNLPAMPSRWHLRSSSRLIGDTSNSGSPDRTTRGSRWGFGSQLAVIDCFRSQDQMALLYGDGSREADEVVHVPVYDEFASFTGAFAMTLARARETLLRFARGTPITALGQWFEL